MKLKNISSAENFSIQVNKGWKPLVFKCLEELDSLNIKIRLLRINNELGGLCIFHDLNGIDNLKVVKVIFKYRELSYKTCEKCGINEKVRIKESEKRFFTCCELCGSSLP